MVGRQGLRATAWAESVGKEIGVASGTAWRPRVGRRRLEAKRQPGCDPGVLTDQRGAFAVWRERLWESYWLGDIPRRRSASSETPPHEQLLRAGREEGGRPGAELRGHSGHRSARRR